MLGQDILWQHAFCFATQTVLNDARVHANASKQQCAL